MSESQPHTQLERALEDEANAAALLKGFQEDLKAAYQLLAEATDRDQKREAIALCKKASDGIDKVRRQLSRAEFVRRGESSKILRRDSVL